MKKTIIIISMLLVSISGLSQEKIQAKEKKNEVHLNTLNLIAFKKLSFSYERLLNDESSIGLSLSSRLGSHVEFEFFTEGDYAITPYYRHHFEFPFFDDLYITTGAFAMLHGGLNDFNIDEAPKKYNDFAFGITTGTKIISEKGFVFDTYAGVGRNFFDENAPEFVARLNISFGYRF